MTRLWICSALLFLSLAASGAELHVALSGNVVSLVPGEQHSIHDYRVAGDLYEPLLWRMADGAMMAGAAESWSHSPDFLQWDFHLRQDARWSDGTSVTAEDFALAVRHLLLNPDSNVGTNGAVPALVGASEMRNGGKNVSLGVFAVTPHHLRLTFAAPMRQLSAFDSFLPIPRHKFTLDRLQGGLPLSNGPFHVTSWQPHGQIVLVKSPTYWHAARVKIDKVIFVPIENPEEQYRRFRVGDIDVTDRVPLRQFDWIKRNMAAELQEWPVGVNRHLVVNSLVGPWAADANVRRALSLAIDRDLIVEGVLRGEALAADIMVPPTAAPDHRPGPSFWPASQIEREREARRLWGLNGPPRPARLAILYATDEQAKKICLAIADMWRRVLGVETDLDNVEYSVRVERQYSRDFALLYRGDVAFEAIGFLQDYDSRAGRENPASYHEPSFDALLDQARQADSAEVRADGLAKAEQILLRDSAVIPLFFPKTHVLVSRRVKGYRPDVTGLYRSWDLEIVR